ncbi:MAG: hypothetical protein IT392_13370 [Nitrospirae bacterium]|nr:hypothetical protein [Nitrospirota bacterium]
MIRCPVRHTGNFLKVVGSLLCGLYAIVSIYAVSCSLSCTFEYDPFEGHSHSHHGAEHDEQHNKQKERGDGESLFCKFLHKVSSSVATVTQLTILVFSDTSHQIRYNSIFLYPLLEKSNPIRAPPVLLS